MTIECRDYVGKRGAAALRCQRIVVPDTPNLAWRSAFSAVCSYWKRKISRCQRSSVLAECARTGDEGVQEAGAAGFRDVQMFACEKDLEVDASHMVSIVV